MLVAVIALPLLLAVAAAMIALTTRGADGADGAYGTSGAGAPGPAGGTAAGTALGLPAVPAPAAGSAECATLQAALPQRLQSGTAQLDRRPLAEPAPRGAAAWGAGGLDETVILRCGVGRPAELTPTAVLLEVSGVRWLRLPGEGATSTWIAVDRPVYVALTVPDDAGTGPLQDLSATVGATLPTRRVEPVR